MAINRVFDLEIDPNNLTQTLQLKIDDAYGVGVMLNNNFPSGDFYIELSIDGIIWAEMTQLTKDEGKPNLIDLTGVTARFIRVRHSGSNLPALSAKGFVVDTP
jgi:hypothetical protein